MRKWAKEGQSRIPHPVPSKSLSLSLPLRSYLFPLSNASPLPLLYLWYPHPWYPHPWYPYLCYAMYLSICEELFRPHVSVVADAADFKRAFEEVRLRRGVGKAIVRFGSAFVGKFLSLSLYLCSFYCNPASPITSISI